MWQGFPEGLARRPEHDNARDRRARIAVDIVLELFEIHVAVGIKRRRDRRAERRKTSLGEIRSHCHKNGQAHDVYLESGMGSNLATLRLHVENAVWSSTGKELKNIKGCELVDLALTPATNTLPIRQLKLEIGSSKSVIAAWVKFPELIVAPLRQRYTRLSETT